MTADQSYRVAVIGHTGRGNYGHGLDVVWRELPGCTITAVADPDETGRSEAAQRLGGVRPYADYAEMLDREKPQIVSIGPRWIDQHRDMVVAAATRGIHIYMEKPFCRTLEEADEIVKACETHRVKLAIAFQTRYSPVLRVVRSIMEEGDLGEILEIRGRGKEDRRGGGEDLWVLGCHVFNLIQTLGGDPEWCFAEVRQAGVRVTGEHVSEGAEGIGLLAGDDLQALYRLPQGVTAFFGSRRDAVQQGTRFGLRILGTRGAIDLSTGYLPLAQLLLATNWAARDGKSWQIISSQGPGKPEPLAGQTNHHGNIAACQDLLHAIEEDRQPEANMYDARTTVAMTAAVFESHRLQSPVTFPLSTRVNPLSLL